MIGVQKRNRKLGMSELPFHHRVPYQTWGGGQILGAKKFPDITSRLLRINGKKYGLAADARI